jgi:hypothetical protein
MGGSLSASRCVSYPEWVLNLNLKLNLKLKLINPQPVREWDTANVTSVARRPSS